jgi:hypothetical protein
MAYDSDEFCLSHLSVLRVLSAVHVGGVSINTSAWGDANVSALGRRAVRQCRGRRRFKTPAHSHIIALQVLFALLC